jgi:hypothetical protein
MSIPVCFQLAAFFSATLWSSIYQSPCVSFGFSFAWHSVVLLGAVCVRLPLVMSLAGGPFLLSLSVRLFIYRSIHPRLFPACGPFLLPLSVNQSIYPSTFLGGSWWVTHPSPPMLLHHMLQVRRGLLDSQPLPGKREAARLPPALLPVGEAFERLGPRACRCSSPWPTRRCKLAGLISPAQRSSWGIFGS